MHTRQSGAAHVPIMFFILLLVMFLGAVGVAYIVTDANTNLRSDNQVGIFVDGLRKAGVPE